MKQLTTLLEQAFERALWASRLVMLIAVVGSLLLAFGSFYLAIIDVISALAIFRNYSVLSLSTQAFTDLRNEAVTTIVRALDGFLISAILLLFAFGVYELFVSKINPARRSTAVLHFLASGTLDELKEKVARLVIVAGDRVLPTGSARIIRASPRSSLLGHRHSTRKRSDLFDRSPQTRSHRAKRRQSPAERNPAKLLALRPECLPRTMILKAIF